MVVAGGWRWPEGALWSANVYLQEAINQGVERPRPEMQKILAFAEDIALSYSAHFDPYMDHMSAI